MGTQKFALPFAILTVLLLSGAGCDPSSLDFSNLPNQEANQVANQVTTQVTTITTNQFGKYKQNGTTKNGVDKYNDMSLATASDQYTSENGNADAVVYSADSATVNQYMSFLIKDEAGDKQRFTKMDVGRASINYRSTDGRLCLFLWTSEGKMVMLNNVECSAEDDLVSGYLKKYPPSSI